MNTLPFLSAALWLYGHSGDMPPATSIGTFCLLAMLSLPLEKHPLLRPVVGLAGFAGLFVGAAGHWWMPIVVDALEGSQLWRPGTFHYPAMPVAALAMWAGIGAAAWWASFRYLPPIIEAIRHKLTRRTVLERGHRTDIRTVRDLLPKPANTYNPTRYFKKGAVFLGLDEAGKPIYLPYAVFCRSHIQLVGTTGAGKGVAAGLMVAQALAAGEAVIVFDPKRDEWTPPLCFQQAAVQGRRFIMIDLGAERPQINLIAGGSPEQVEELLVAGLGLSDRGDAADHYRMRDRQAARSLARSVLRANPAATLADLVEAAEADSAMAENAEGFVGRLAEIATGGAITAAAGPDLADLIQQGACIYVTGSMRHSRILAVQRMMLVRLMQIVEGRDRLTSPPRNVLIFLDELKAHISRPALEMLAAIRDKGAHIILAHQSLGDLRDCPADLNPDAVADAVIENCRVRVAYRVQNPDTAAWLARTTGKILVDDEARQVGRGVMAETVTGDRIIRQGERPHVDENMFLALPERVAVVYTPEGVRFSHICPIPTTKASIPIAVGHPRPGAGCGDDIEQLPDVTL